MQKQLAGSTITHSEQLKSNQFFFIDRNQLYRSSTSPAFNYGEAQSAETRRDFIHKMKISLKELRETMVGLKFIDRGNYKPDVAQLKALLIETNELISIFVVSIQTAERNLRFKQPNK